MAAPAYADCRDIFESTPRSLTSYDEIKVEIRRNRSVQTKDRFWMIRLVSLLKFRLIENRLVKTCMSGGACKPELIKDVVKYESEQVIAILGKARQHLAISLWVAIPMSIANALVGIVPEKSHLIVGITIGAVVSTTIAPILTPLTAWIGRWHQRNRYIDMLKIDQYFEMVEIWRRTSAEYSSAEMSTVYRVDQFMIRNLPLFKGSAEAFEAGNTKRGITMMATALYHIRVLSRDVPLNRFALNTIAATFEEVREFPPNLREKLLKRIEKFDPEDYTRPGVAKLYEDNTDRILKFLLEQGISNSSVVEEE